MTTRTHRFWLRWSPVLFVTVVLIKALTRWGGALIEMAHLHRGDESAALIDEVCLAR